ncbi:MAG: DUF5674 family protein [Candidatus Methylomirabilales bacterium]
MTIQIVREPITLDALRSLAHGQFGDFVKAVVNLYPDRVGADRIEFDSMINIRPSQGNRSRSVEDPALRQQIVNVVTGLISA